jgi:transcriptional regulator with PAS, ATPase and Fis domain
LVGRQVVGRDKSCDVVLPGTQISRRHADLSVADRMIAVRDLESSNGVFINGTRCSEGSIPIGGVIRCGEWIGVAVAEGPTAAGFGEIAAGWFGGATLRAAVEPGRRLSSDLPVVVQGETGTGKEGVARAVHAWSGRSGPFVALNCAALPAELADGELFGYRKGAFTGATAASRGLFRAADGGTIFLDEILELPEALQAKLLRVLEGRTVRGLGDPHEVPIDVRLVAATQRPLRTAVRERLFRADLHARLDGLTIVLPSLRARREDIAPLFLEFLRQHGEGSPPAVDARLIEMLCLYDWPLNVRELRLLARQLLAVHGREPILKRSHLPDRITLVADAAELAPAPCRPATKRVWRRTRDGGDFGALIAALRTHGGSVAQAAAAMNVSRSRAYRLLSANPDFSLERLRASSRTPDS